MDSRSRSINQTLLGDICPQKKIITQDYYIPISFTEDLNEIINKAAKLLTIYDKVRFVAIGRACITLKCLK